MASRFVASPPLMSDMLTRIWRSNLFVRPPHDNLRRVWARARSQLPSGRQQWRAHPLSRGRPNDRRARSYRGCQDQPIARPKLCPTTLRPFVSTSDRPTNGLLLLSADFTALSPRSPAAAAWDPAAFNLSAAEQTRATNKHQQTGELVNFLCSARQN